MRAGTNGSSELAGTKVLVVEDEAVIAYDLESTLRRLGCLILPAAPSVAAALALLRTEEPEVALLDIRLADGEVTPAAEVLAARGVPFAVVTGYDGEPDQPALSKAPRLGKPYNVGELQQVIRRLLHERSVRARA